MFCNILYFKCVSGWQDAVLPVLAVLHDVGGRLQQQAVGKKDHVLDYSVIILRIKGPCIGLLSIILMSTFYNHILPCDFGKINFN